jgi:nitric oxide reductase subunit C
MTKIIIAFLLFLAFIIYSGFIYTRGTASDINISPSEQKLASEGKQIYQQYNCQACHQVYGLGGYLGPDLTTAYSDPHRGKMLIKAMLVSGGNRMPVFQFNDEQIEALTAYLKYVDTTATPIKPRVR